MKLKKTTNCNDCRALQHHSIGMECSLGFKNKKYTSDKHFGTLIAPLERCYKPKTYAELFVAKELLQPKSGRIIS